MRKILAAMLVGAFAGQTLLLPWAEASEYSHIWETRRKNTVLGELPTLKSSFPVSVTNPSVPAALQSLVSALPQDKINIREVSASVPTTKSPVVLVQDVHMNPEAQLNVAAALQQLTDSKQIERIAVEGAFGSFHFDESRKLASKEGRRDVARSFVEQKLMGAASLYGISNDQTPPIIGVDDRSHYHANVTAYLAMRPFKKKVQRDLEKTKKDLNQKKAAVLSPALLTFDDLRQAHHDGSIPFGSYLKKLVAMSPDHDLVLEQFIQAYDLENTLDFARVENERRRVIEKLTQQLEATELKQLVDQSLAYRAGQMTFGAYFQQLKRLCEKSGVRLSEYKAFDRYVRYVLLSDGIQPDRLFERMEKKEEEVLGLLIQTPEQKELTNNLEWVRLAQKMTEFELTPHEWEKYRRNAASVPLRTFESFYEQADIRSHLMIENLLAMSSGPSVLIAGGFHTSQMTHILKEKIVPYIVIAPKLTKVESESASATLNEFSREKTPLEKMFSGPKLFIIPQNQMVWSGNEPSVATQQAYDLFLTGITGPGEATTPDGLKVQVVAGEAPNALLTIKRPTGEKYSLVPVEGSLVKQAVFDGVKQIRINDATHMSVAEQSELVRAAVAENHRAQQYAVVLDRKLSERLPIDLTLVPRELDMEQSTDLNRALEETFLLQRRAVSLNFKKQDDGNFFHIYADPDGKTDVRLEIPGASGQHVHFSVNLGRAARPGGGGQARICSLCSKVVLDKFPNEIGMRLGRLLLFFNPDPLWPSTKKISAEGQPLHLVMTWGEEVADHADIGQRKIRDPDKLFELFTQWSRINRSSSLEGKTKFGMIINGWDGGGASQNHIHVQIARKEFDSEKAVVHELGMHPAYDQVKVGVVDIVPESAVRMDDDVQVLSFEVKGNQNLKKLSDAVAETLASIEQKGHSYNIFAFEIPNGTETIYRVFLTGRLEEKSKTFGQGWGAIQVLLRDIQIEDIDGVQLFFKLTKDQQQKLQEESEKAIAAGKDPTTTLIGTISHWLSEGVLAPNDANKLIEAFRAGMSETSYSKKQLADVLPLELSRKMQDLSSKKMSRSPLLQWLLFGSTGLFALVWSMVISSDLNSGLSYGAVLFGSFSILLGAWGFFETVSVLSVKLSWAGGSGNEEAQLHRLSDQLVPTSDRGQIQIRLAERHELSWFETGRTSDNTIIIHPAFAGSRSVLAHELSHWRKDKPSHGFLRKEIRARAFEWNPNRLIELTKNQRKLAAQIMADINPALPKGLSEFGNERHLQLMSHQVFAKNSNAPERSLRDFVRPDAKGTKQTKILYMPLSETAKEIIAEVNNFRRGIPEEVRDQVTIEVVLKKELSRQLNGELLNVGTVRVLDSLTRLSRAELLELPSGGQAERLQFLIAEGAHLPNSLPSILGTLSDNLKEQFEYGMLMDGMVKKFNVADFFQLKLFEERIINSQA